ncbi:hypothetical protein S2091_4607 [Solimicrobium silvestre]|uniref:Uncharacterized protein n=1 Tax=Solimicrobium silvestre TaxID=2099400 RepID=A0A2S9GSL8_9BURK|nr:hypothetical protein S2091_4607 [Solimicrobium silvestre]
MRTLVDIPGWQIDGLAYQEKAAPNGKGTVQFWVSVFGD